MKMLLFRGVQKRHRAAFLHAFSVYDANKPKFSQLLSFYFSSQTWKI